MISGQYFGDNKFGSLVKWQFGTRTQQHQDISPVKQRWLGREIHFYLSFDWNFPVKIVWKEDKICESITTVNVDNYILACCSTEGNTYDIKEQQDLLGMLCIYSMLVTWGPIKR